MKTAVTPIISNIRENINKKADAYINNKTHDLKYVLLSAHDSTIAQLLLDNGHIDPQCLI